RHTIFSRDWSSDVCSSDLLPSCIQSCISLRQKLINVLYHKPQPWICVVPFNCPFRNGNFILLMILNWEYLANTPLSSASNTSSTQPERYMPRCLVRGLLSLGFLKRR